MWPQRALVAAGIAVGPASHRVDRACSPRVLVAGLAVAALALLAACRLGRRAAAAPPGYTFR